MYPVIIAHANDHAAEGAFIQTSGGLLMLYGFGAIAGPAVAGFAMAAAGQRGLFLTTAAAHVVLIAFAALRIALRAPVPDADKAEFLPIPPARAATPETAALALGEGAETETTDPE
jgi:MFS family permease